MTKAEKFIKDHTRNCSNELIFTTEEDKTCKEYSPWLTPEQALSAVKIAREEAVEETVDWLIGGFSKYISAVKETDVIAIDCKLFEDFRKFMDEQV